MNNTIFFSNRQLPRSALMILALFALSGCHNLYIAVPYVLAPDNAFVLDIGVKNEKDNAIEIGKIKLEINATVQTKYDSTCTISKSFINNSRLEADGGWWYIDEPLSTSAPGSGDKCYCSKASQCKGTVRMKLVSTKDNMQLSGHKTKFSVYFDGSGTKQGLTIHDLSD